MIQFSNVKPLHSYNLTNNGIPHQFAFGQITVNVELSSVTRINGILIDAIKKLAGLQSHKDAVIQVEPKTDSLINNKLLIKEPTIASSQIIDRFFKFIFESKKPAQTFARFNKKHNLNSYGIFPAIKSNASEEFLISNNREDIITHDGLAFNFAVTNPINLKVEDRKILQHDLQTIRATPLIQTYFNNVEKLSDQELLWFITNSISYKAARKELNKMKKRNARIAYYYKVALDIYPEPLSYKKIIGDNKFPYEYLYQAINSPIIPTMRITENIGAVTQAEISVLLKEAQERFICREDKMVVLLRTDTGSGKTSTIKDFFSPNMAYAGPTHKLIGQFMNDVKKVHSNLDIVYIPPITDADIPECKHKEVMKYHERRGEYDKVREFRDKAIREHGTLAQKQLLNKYKEALKKESGTPFITHSRLINNGLGFFNGTKFQEIDTIIIDEDILPALFPSSVELDLYVIRAIESVIELVTTDLNPAGFGMDETNQDESKREVLRALQIFLSQIKSAKIKGVVKNRAKNIVDSYSGIINAYIKRLKSITLNLSRVLTCSVLTCKNHSKVPSTIYTQDYSHVLRGKKIMLMSATLDKKVHLELFRQRINVNTEWIDLPRTEIKGKIICHTDFSTTRNAFSRYPERMNIIKSQIEKLGNIDQVITYKDLKEEFGSVSHMHFYNTAGYNDYSGKNLAIVGTPNNLPENVVTLHYLIYGEVPKSLKFDKESNEVSYHLSNRAMIRDEYKFSFFTFSHTEDENVRAIHSWFTYNELLQSVGRARLTHYDCEVHVFSRLPIPQCVLAHELES